MSNKSASDAPLALPSVSKISARRSSATSPATLFRNSRGRGIGGLPWLSLMGSSMPSPRSPGRLLCCAFGGLWRRGGGLGNRAGGDAMASMDCVSAAVDSRCSGKLVPIWRTSCCGGVASGTSTMARAGGAGGVVLVLSDFFRFGGGSTTRPCSPEASASSGGDRSGGGACARGASWPPAAAPAFSELAVFLTPTLVFFLTALVPVLFPMGALAAPPLLSLLRFAVLLVVSLAVAAGATGPAVATASGTASTSSYSSSPVCGWKSWSQPSWARIHCPCRSKTRTA
mmetsp:Transcript_5378/g.13415  ORF Transcript_5378/g.13415 Transcript_5378/m.13415 type:complete len:285 (+) Transcript_5378:606-1460(+)